jgi:hypothetical protein
MKQIVSLVVLALAALPLPAAAQAAAEGNVGVDGRVAPVCILGDPNPATVNLGQLSAASGPRTGRVATIANRTVVLPTSRCNFAGTVITVQTTALIVNDPAAPPTGFTRAVNYTGSVAGWTSGAAAATSSALRDGTNATGTSTGAVQPLPRLADLTLTLSNFTTPGDGFLVAGNYSGTVVITLGPQAVAP